MGGKLRTPALIVALIAAFLIIGVEMGSSFRANGSMVDGLTGRFSEIAHNVSQIGTPDAAPQGSKPVDSFSGLEKLLKTPNGKPPGLAIPTLINLDTFVLFTLILFCLPLVVKPSVIAQTQGVATVIISIVVLIWSVIGLLKCLVELFIMIGLLLAIPFGTILYMILFADFDVKPAAAILSTLMFLKIVLAVCLPIAHERFLRNIGVILLLATSFIAMIVISFLHSFLPIFLTSITDAIAGIIVCVLAIIWAIILLIGGIIGVVKVLLKAKTIVAS